jgi:hypothetical protein
VIILLQKKWYSEANRTGKSSTNIVAEAAFLVCTSGMEITFEGYVHYQVNCK